MRANPQYQKEHQWQLFCLIFLSFELWLCIPMNPDTDSNNLRTPIPIQSGHPFRSKADTPQLERSDAGKFVNASRYF